MFIIISARCSSNEDSFWWTLSNPKVQKHTVIITTFISNLKITLFVLIYAHSRKNLKTGPELVQLLIHKRNKEINLSNSYYYSASNQNTTYGSAKSIGRAVS